MLPFNMPAVTPHFIKTEKDFPTMASKMSRVIPPSGNPVIYRA